MMTLADGQIGGDKMMVETLILWFIWPILEFLGLVMMILAFAVRQKRKRNVVFVVGFVLLLIAVIIFLWHYRLVIIT